MDKEMHEKIRGFAIAIVFLIAWLMLVTFTIMLVTFTNSMSLDYAANVTTMAGGFDTYNTNDIFGLGPFLSVVVVVFGFTFILILLLWFIRSTAHGMKEAD